MRKLGIVTLMSATLLIAGCAASGTSYSQPEQLAEAYIAAGGECSSSMDVPESMVSDGAHSLLCEDTTMVIVFDSEENKNGYIAAVGDSESAIVGGERWVVIGGGVEDKASALGGTVIVE